MRNEIFIVMAKGAGLLRFIQLCDTPFQVPVNIFFGNFYYYNFFYILFICDHVTVNRVKLIIHVTSIKQKCNYKSYLNT